MTKWVTKSGSAKLLRSRACLICLCLPAFLNARSAMGLEEYVQTFAQPVTGTTWSVPVGLDKFRPSWGTLTEVQFSWTATFSGSITVQNQSATEQEYITSLTGNVRFLKTSTNGTSSTLLWGQVNAGSAADTLTIPAGQTDVYSPGAWNVNTSTATTLTSETDLDYFRGTGTIPAYFRAASISNVVGENPYLANPSSTASATLSLKYIYAVPEPTSWALGAISVVATACMIRKRNRLSRKAEAGA